MRTLSLALLSGLSATAGMAETMQLSIPEPFTLAFETQEGEMFMQEYIDPAETLESWSRMITYQRFGDAEMVPLEPFMSAIGGALRDRCPGGQSAVGHRGMQNGYAVSILFTFCPDSPLKPGQPEQTMYKFLQGEEALHLLQFAWRYEPHRDEVQVALGWSVGQLLCSPERQDPPCRGAGKNQ